MTDLFPGFAKNVASTFQGLVTGYATKGHERSGLFVVDITGDALYEAYLAAFPEGTNPKYRERTEHDCSCCKQFIRRVGNMVYVNEHGHRSTIWGKTSAGRGPYDVVTETLHGLVLSAEIVDIFRVAKSEGSFGVLKNHAMDKEGKLHEYHHFHTGEIPKQLRSDTSDKDRGDYRTTVQVFTRGLEELKPDAIETVLSLINSKDLYRGDEHRKAVAEFQKAQQTWASRSAGERMLFTWTNAQGPASRFRNTVIGTLVQDLSEGVPVEKAVHSFETKVAPSNYKRTTSVITPMMVKKAMETIQELDLEPALERRFARLEDISVNDVLWVDGKVKPLMKGGLGDVLMKAAKSGPAKVDEAQAKDIDLDAFVGTVLREATGMEMLFKNEHSHNLVSLTAPVHKEPKKLFKWNNDFAWSYNGNITDSELRKAVQSRGGRVDGVFRFSHQWNYDKRNASLMDLHVFMPGSGIKYSEPGVMNDSYGSFQRVGWNNRKHPSSGGSQDVDYVEAAPVGYVPVENITFPDIQRMPEGAYICKIHNWNLRPPTEGGFRAEIEFGGQVFAYEYLKPMKNKEWVTVATVTLKGGAFTIEHHLPHGTTSQEKWGLKTEQYVKVNAVTLSPNYWGDNKVGNKHTFFMLEGAKNDEPTRGIYNEFLHPRLEEHRKVFEVIGDKTKCQPTEGQLSGLGFSSTKKDSVIVKVASGTKQRLFNVHIGS